MRDGDGYRPDPFAIAALVFSLASAGIAFMHYIDYSEVELLPIDQVVIMLDDRREDRPQTVIAPEIAVFNAATGSYSDAIRGASLEATTARGDRFCFRDLAYARLRIDGERFGARMRQAANGAINLEDAAPRGAADSCAELECIRQGKGDEFVLTTLDDPIPQTLAAGSVFSGRLAFVSQACGPNNQAPSFEAMLDAMLDQETRVDFAVDTLHDGRHTAACTFSLPPRAHSFAKDEHVLVLTCAPVASPEPPPLSRVRDWLDGLI